ncbi:MAG: TonB-dependent receptor [Ignavibacteriales bacterium]|nr:TonB-dependent receptor [Ignavibacteriales bacterium]
MYDFSTIKLRFSGSYEENIRKNGQDWPGAIVNMFRSKRVTESKTRSAFGSLKATHVLNPTTFYEVSVSFQQRKFKTYDPDFKDNWAAYSDSIANANLGYSGFRSRFQGPLPYAIVTDLLINHENTPINSYVKNRQDNIGVTVDFTSQLERNIELKVGGNLNAWTMRQWSIGNISNYLRYRFGEDGKSTRTWASEEERRVELARFTNGNINYYGYDVDGREVESGVDGPRTPLLASAYVQSKFEFQDLVLNLGARLEYYDLDTKTPANPGDYLSWFDSGLDVIDEDKLKDSDPISYLLPRVSFSFPVTENTVFFAQYGRYSQLPALSLLYAGNTFVSRTVSPTSRGNAFLTPVGLLGQPEKTTQYEVGFRQIVSENFALTISGYYKDLQDLISVRKQTNELGQALYNAYLNKDFGTVKGLELTLELRRTQGLLAKLNYTLADARGTGSNSQSAFGVVEHTVFTATPNFIAPLDFNRTHQGSLIVDYRLARGEGGPYLEGFGVNAIFSFNSGRPFTRIAPPTSLGQAQTFEFGVRAISDPRSRVPVEPLNASTGPWNFNLDLAVSKAFYIQDITLEVFLNVLNVFDSKRVQNVFPTTGTPEDDGFLSTPLAVAYRDIPNYVDMYRTLNLDNRYFYLRAGGQDVYGAPREVRVGLKVEI